MLPERVRQLRIAPAGRVWVGRDPGPASARFGPLEHLLRQNNGTRRSRAAPRSSMARGGIGPEPLSGGQPAPPGGGRAPSPAAKGSQWTGNARPPEEGDNTLLTFWKGDGLSGRRNPADLGHPERRDLAHGPDAVPSGWTAVWISRDSSPEPAFPIPAPGLTHQDRFPPVAGCRGQVYDSRARTSLESAPADPDQERWGDP